jgi:hypothetical protein
VSLAVAAPAVQLCTVGASAYVSKRKSIAFEVVLQHFSHTLFANSLLIIADSSRSSGAKVTGLWSGPQCAAV